MHADEWVSRAACRGTDTEIFMDYLDHPRTDWSEPAAYCDRCEVRAECLAAGMRAMDYLSYLGGTTPAQRLRMLMPERMGHDDAITASVPASTPVNRNRDPVAYRAWRRQREAGRRVHAALRSGAADLRRTTCPLCGVEFVTQFAHIDRCWPCLTGERDLPAANTQERASPRSE